MITKKQVRFLLDNIENERIERTISVKDTDKFAKAICAFAKVSVKNADIQPVVEGTEKGTEENNNPVNDIKKAQKHENITEKGTEKGTENNNNSENDIKKAQKHENITEKGTEKINANQKLILDYISKNPSVTSNELSTIIGIRADNIRVNLSKLKAKGLIERVGGDKGGSWIIKGKS